MICQMDRPGRRVDTEKKGTHRITHRERRDYIAFYQHERCDVRGVVLRSNPKNIRDCPDYGPYRLDFPRLLSYTSCIVDTTMERLGIAIRLQGHLVAPDFTFSSVERAGVGSRRRGDLSESLRSRRRPNRRPLCRQDHVGW